MGLGTDGGEAGVDDDVSQLKGIASDISEGG